ncbi:hypothetical protein PSACC_00133 [Paramicrosporidium saccamoebae]|uniref:Uncharacterized protein n=1 Tax=Paramicrosporidium saccamoebae TaxID=1246581 RepID=A0A2H9TQR1_9FUNG|nr:hypothetical protein PSACC_00133 [Paramicrosporidium saccamoebae]
MPTMLFILAHQCTLVRCRGDKRTRTLINSTCNPPSILRKGPRRIGAPKQVRFYRRLADDSLPTVATGEYSYTVPKDYYKITRNTAKARSQSDTSSSYESSMESHTLTSNWAIASECSLSGRVPTLSRFSRPPRPSGPSGPSRILAANYSQKERSRIKDDPESTSFDFARKTLLRTPTQPFNPEPKKKNCGCAECLGETKFYVLLVLGLLAGLVLLVPATDAAGTIAHSKPGCCHGPAEDKPAGDLPTAEPAGKAPLTEPIVSEPDEKPPSKCPITTYCTLYNILLAAAVVTGIVFVIFFAKYFLPANTGKA